jgi:hypothetical protein
LIKLNPHDLVIPSYVYYLFTAQAIWKKEEDLP